MEENKGKESEPKYPQSSPIGHGPECGWTRTTINRGHPKASWPMSVLIRTWAGWLRWNFLSFPPLSLGHSLGTFVQLFVDNLASKITHN